MVSFGKLSVNSGPDHDAYENALGPFACESPAELDSTEVPYVQSNTLAGCANEIAELADDANRRPMIDSAVCLSTVADVNVADFDSPLSDPFFEQMLYADHALTAVAMLPTPPLTPPSGSLSDLAEILPIDCVADNSDATMTEADAHYQSEQELFELPATSVLVSSPKASVMDIATFLKLGHPRDCWCGYCEEEFQVVSEDSEIERLEAESPHHDDDDDDWSWYSEVEDDRHTSPELEAAATVISEEEKEVAAHPCASAPGSDTVFPKLPSSAWEVRRQAHGKQGSSLAFAYDHGWECEF